MRDRVLMGGSFKPEGQVYEALAVGIVVGLVTGSLGPLLGDEVRRWGRRRRAERDLRKIISDNRRATCDDTRDPDSDNGDWWDLLWTDAARRMIYDKIVEHVERHLEEEMRYLSPISQWRLRRALALPEEFQQELHPQEGAVETLTPDQARAQFRELERVLRSVLS